MRGVLSERNNLQDTGDSSEPFKSLAKLNRQVMGKLIKRSGAKESVE